jgi:hypothetical protein
MFRSQGFSLKYKQFDICGSHGSTLDGFRNGFIHSPNYPNYYGNRRNCWMSLKLAANQKLIVYLVQISMEDASLFHSNPNDYVMFNNDRNLQFFSRSNEPRLVYEGRDRDRVDISFKSDWITTQSLTYPKGFLVYFECNLFSFLFISTIVLIKECLIRLFRCNDHCFEHNDDDDDDNGDF